MNTMIADMSSMNQQMAAYLSRVQESYKANQNAHLCLQQQQQQLLNTANAFITPIGKSVVPPVYNAIPLYFQDSAAVPLSMDALRSYQQRLVMQEQENRMLLNSLSELKKEPRLLKRPRTSLSQAGTRDSAFVKQADLNQTTSPCTVPVRPLKKTRNGRRVCVVDDCVRYAQGRTKRCISHGGGNRCGNSGCPKSAFGSTKFCIAHGGGERCEVEGCFKSTQGPTKRCKAHGGGRRCKEENCIKSAQGGAYCKIHGGGSNRKRCLVSGCNKQVRGKNGCCIIHGRAMKTFEIRKQINIST